MKYLLVEAIKEEKKRGILTEYEINTQYNQFSYAVNAHHQRVSSCPSHTNYVGSAAAAVVSASAAAVAVAAVAANAASSAAVRKKSSTSSTSSSCSVASSASQSSSSAASSSNQSNKPVDEPHHIVDYAEPTISNPVWFSL